MRVKPSFAGRLALPACSIAAAALMAAWIGWPPNADAGSGASLPLVVLQAACGGETLAIFYSGDGGWGPLDKRVSQDLVGAGVAVVGYNSLRYFWRPRTAAGAAADLSAVMEDYTTKWGRPRVILIGYSFGADALPAIIERLPARSRAKVRMLALISPETTGRLHVGAGGWFQSFTSRGFSVTGELARLRGIPTVCIYGAGDRHAACRSFPPSLGRTVALAGGHHFDGRYSAVAQVLLDFLSIGEACQPRWVTAHPQAFARSADAGGRPAAAGAEDRPAAAKPPSHRPDHSRAESSFDVRWRRVRSAGVGDVFQS